MFKREIESVRLQNGWQKMIELWDSDKREYPKIWLMYLDVDGSCKIIPRKADVGGHSTVSEKNIKRPSHKFTTAILKTMFSLLTLKIA